MTTTNQTLENTQIKTNQSKEKTMESNTNVENNQTNPSTPKSCNLTYQANLDIVELEQGVELLFDMPGVEKENISIKVEQNQLAVKGVPNQAKIQPGTLIYQEHKPGNYARTVDLSDELDREKIEASFDDGVLRVFLPKRDEVIPQSITIH